MPVNEASALFISPEPHKPMAEITHLTKAPLVEALIDLRVQLQTPFDISRLDAIHDKIIDSYPTKAVLKKFSGRIDFTDEGASPKMDLAELHGYRYTSSDKTFVFQARADGFTLSRLRPYSFWEDLVEEAKRLWAIYVEAAGVELVIREAVRYINRMEISLPIVDFAEYLTCPPVIPERLPQALSSFLMRFVMHDDANDISAIVTQSLEESPTPVAALILDIDAFKEGSYEVQAA